MLKIGSLLGAAIAAAVTGITAFAPALAQQALEGAGPCPLGEALIPGADKKPPTLDTNWAPINGTAVRPGDQIKVTMVARDDPDPWPSGIKAIQLVADSEDGRFITSENYEACSEPRERRVEATYTVPANPPPIVRLTALAEDHAGLTDTDVGEFPTSVEGEHEDTADREQENRTDQGIDEPCVGAARWVGSIRGIHKPSWGHQVKRSAESVRLCEGPLVPPIEYVIKGQAYYIELFDAGSTITHVHKDVGDSCRISGGGTLPLMRTVGSISSTLEEVGPNGELRWSQPTYHLSAAPEGDYTYSETCTGAYGTETRTPTGGGWAINIGTDSYDPQTGNRKLEGGRMAGSYATPDGITASWSLSRQGGAPLFPASSAGQVIEVAPQ